MNNNNLLLEHSSNDVNYIEIVLVQKNVTSLSMIYILMRHNVVLSCKTFCSNIQKTNFSKNTPLKPYLTPWS